MESVKNHNACGILNTLVSRHHHNCASEFDREAPQTYTPESRTQTLEWLTADVDEVIRSLQSLLLPREDTCPGDHPTVSVGIFSDGSVGLASSTAREIMYRNSRIFLQNVVLSSTILYSAVWISMRTYCVVTFRAMRFEHSLRCMARVINDAGGVVIPHLVCQQG